VPINEYGLNCGDKIVAYIITVIIRESYVKRNRLDTQWLEDIKDAN
jgi:hypothetical protein